MFQMRWGAGVLTPVERRKVVTWRESVGKKTVRGGGGGGDDGWSVER